jgi:hypothetical protein
VQTIRAQSLIRNPVILRERQSSKIIERDVALTTTKTNQPTCRFHLRRKVRVVWPDGSVERLTLDVYHPTPFKNDCIGAPGSARPGAPPLVRMSPYKKFGGRGRLVRGGKFRFDCRLKEQQAWNGIGNGSYTKDGEIVPVDRPAAPEPETVSARALVSYWSEGMTPEAVAKHAELYAQEMSRRERRESK